MSSSFDKLPLEAREQIDAACCAFEREWKAGARPRLADYVNRVDALARRRLIRELLAIELDYRRGECETPLSEESLKREHALASPEIAEDLAQLTGVFDGDDARTSDVVPESSSKMRKLAGAAQPTVARGHTTAPSSGLHIRCPHCSNSIELVAETPFESVTCSVCGSAFSLVDREAETRRAAPLKTLGRFELIEFLGGGGFGWVWKARDTELERVVAIKVPRKGQLDDEEIEMFYREARAVAQLRHPNIVPVHEVGREQDTIFIVSDLVRGVPLSNWMSEGPQDPRQTAQMGAVIADALEHAHQHGVIHRDLKPSNILVDDQGNLHLVDFGLAKRDAGEITMTVDGRVLGTPAYMSPEQARGQNRWIDRRTDIYSLGVMFFHMLTGELPFRGNAQMQIHRRLSDDAPDPRSLNRHIPRDMATICLKCLERDPNRRYAKAADLADELRRFLRGEPIHARPVSRVERVLRWSRRKPALAAAAGLTVILAVGGPLAAIAIDLQRQRLGELVSEKNNLIAEYAAEKQQDANRISQLSSELDVWEGRANPWAVWPPGPQDKASTAILAKLLTRTASTPEATRAMRLDSEQQAYRHLSLAIMNDELMRAQQAMEQYKAASDCLRELVASQPSDARYRLALADCLTQMARLSVENGDAQGSASESRRLLDSASELLGQLAESPNARAVMLRQLDTELRAAVAAGFESAPGHLTRAEDIAHTLTEDFPSDPAELYEFTCLLARREAVLKKTVATER